MGREAAKARAALERTLHELAATAARAVSPPAWIARYPWWSVGIAAATGFVLGRKLRGHAPPPTAPSAATEPAPAPVHQPPPPSRTATFLADLAAPLGGVLAEVLLGIARQAIHQAFTPPGPEPGPAAPRPASPDQTPPRDEAGPRAGE